MNKYFSRFYKRHFLIDAGAKFVLQFSAVKRLFSSQR